MISEGGVYTSIMRLALPTSFAMCRSSGLIFFAFCIHNNKQLELMSNVLSILLADLCDHALKMPHDEL